MQDDVSVMTWVRYDPTKGCFVLKPTQQIEYWPGTAIPKSKDNDFNWQTQPSQVLRQLYPHVYKNDTRGKPFTIYSKAQASK
jgi:hypothetical protein